MNTTFNEDGMRDLKYWILENKRIASKICDLIESIKRDGVMKGLGKPEKLKYEDTYSRRIDEANRLVYKVSNDAVSIISCKGHYKE